VPNQRAPEASPLRRKRRLIIVANRLPVHRVGGGGGGGPAGESGRWESSAGGLVTAMEPVLADAHGTWVGWSGVSGRPARPFKHNNVSIRPVPLSASEVEQFYHGFSNRTLWPLYHDAIRTPEFKREWWWPYVDVNGRYARAAASAARRGDMVWVHDYQLQLVPKLLRELRPDVRIGFFLHIPFPPEELFAWLPWRQQLLEGLLGADVVGFQTYANAQNFSRVARDYTAAEGTDTELEFLGRTVRVGTYPISIDTKWFEQQAGSAPATREAQEIRKRVGPQRKIILCVDRLDYTKGIETRLRAFEELLRKRRLAVDKVVMVQIAVPSRETVPDYARTRDRVEQMVGRINGEFSAPGRVAVHYFRRSLNRHELVAYYRAADVMLVTPLRDGMNLVAKEYIACRTDSSGVLVLSEFTGAARELRRALLVNPRDLDGMAATIEAAVKLPRSEARHRMAILRTVVRRHDVHEWAGQFLEALNR
jgi:trehalose 6-phosphate synthase